MAPMWRSLPQFLKLDSGLCHTAVDEWDAVFILLRKMPKAPATVSTPHPDGSQFHYNHENQSCISISSALESGSGNKIRDFRDLTGVHVPDFPPLLIGPEITVLELSLAHCFRWTFSCRRTSRTTKFCGFLAVQKLLYRKKVFAKRKSMTPSALSALNYSLRASSVLTWTYTFTHFLNPPLHCRSKQRCRTRCAALLHFTGLLKPQIRKYRKWSLFGLYRRSYRDLLAYYFFLQLLRQKKWVWCSWTKSL